MELREFIMGLMPNEKLTDDEERAKGVRISIVT